MRNNSLQKKNLPFKIFLVFFFNFPKIFTKKMTEDSKPNLKDVLSCPICLLRYSRDSNIPKVLPCGKTICDKCIPDTIKNKPCKFCSNEHNYSKRSNFSTNDIILILLSTNEGNSTFKTESKFNRNTKYRRLNQVLGEVEANSKELDLSIKNSKENLIKHFSSIEKEIHTRTDKLLEELKQSRDLMLKELHAHKTSALSYLNEGVDENSNILTFNKDCKRNYSKLIDTVQKMSSIDEHELSKLAQMADELNDRVLQTKSFFENCIKSDLKFLKSSLKPDTHLIGRLEFNNKLQESNKPRPKSHELNKVKTVKYRIPSDCNSIQLSVLPNCLILKILEMAVIENFTYILNIQLINSDGFVIHKVTELIGSYHLKRFQTNNFNDCFTILLVNKFPDSSNLLKLYDSELKLVKTIGISDRPSQVLMSQKHVYTVTTHGNTSQTISKYDYSLNLVKSFGQSSAPQDSYFMPRGFKILAFQNEKIFFIDTEKSRVRIMNELNGKIFRSFSIEANFGNEQERAWSSYDRNYFMIKIDSVDCIHVLNKKLMRLLVFNADGLLLNQKKLDINTRVYSIDYFFALNDSIYSFIDKNNNSIQYF